MERSPEAPSPSLDHLPHCESHQGKKKRIFHPDTFCDSSPRLKSSERTFRYKLCGHGFAPPGQQAFDARGHGAPQKVMVRGGGQGFGESSDSNSTSAGGRGSLTHLWGRTAKAGHQEETQTKTARSVKAFPRDDHRNNTWILQHNTFGNSQRNSHPHPMPLEAPKSLYSSLKGWGRKTGQWRVRKGRSSSHTNYLKLPSVCLIHCRRPPAASSSWGESKLPGGSRLLATRQS